MGRPYLIYNKAPPKAKDSGDLCVTHKQAVNGCRVILLDSALELQEKATRIYKKPKIDCPQVSTRQENRTVLELNDHISLIKTNKKPKVNFVEFINCSKVKSNNNNKYAVDSKQKFEQIKVNQEYSEESCLEPNKNKNSSLVLVQNSDKILKISKPVLNLIPATIKKVPFVPIKPKLILDDINLKKEQQRHTIQLGTQTAKVEAQPVKLTKPILVHSMSSKDSENTSKVPNEQRLLNKKIFLHRVIKLHPLNLNTFKSSQKNKKHHLSSIVKTVIKNNLLNELQQNKSKEAFPVALKSINNEDIKLLDLNSNQSSEQILGI